jgi:hypothetical protein
MKTASITEELTPQLVYLRRAGVTDPVELVISCEGRLILCPVSDAAVLGMVADGAHFLRTRR